jgi:uncharacterized protein
MTNSEITKYSKEITSLCLAHNVKTLFAFGSVLNSQFNSKSDIDLIVDIESEDPFVYSDHYFDLKFQLQELFKRPIDLLEQKAVKNPYLIQEINNTKVLVYGK